MLACLLLMLCAEPEFASVGVNYCGPAVPNSSGQSAEMSAFGSGRAGDPLRLVASGLPHNQFAIFIVSPQPGYYHIPFSQGVICMDFNQTARFNSPQQTASTCTGGVISLMIDTNALPMAIPTAVMPGDRWYFQAWFRENHVLDNGFSDAIAISFH